MFNELSFKATPTLSYFTHALREQCLAKGAASARMRSGDWVKVEYVDGSFLSADRKQLWHADGNSANGTEFDLVEFAPAKDVLDNWLPLAVDVRQMRNVNNLPAPLWH